MTSNQHYRGLRRRFEKRARLLSRLGWAYWSDPDMHLAMFRRKSWMSMTKFHAIPISTLHFATNAQFTDVLATTLRRGFVYHSPMKGSA